MSNRIDTAIAVKSAVGHVLVIRMLQTATSRSNKSSLPGVSNELASDHEPPASVNHAWPAKTSTTYDGGSAQLHRGFSTEARGVGGIRTEIRTHPKAINKTKDEKKQGVRQPHDDVRIIHMTAVPRSDLGKPT